MSTELAKLNNNELVYGTHAEVEAYAISKNTVVDNYLNHVNPSTVQKAFTYVGNSMCDPYSIPRPIYNFDEDGVYTGMRTFKEKF
mgnify:CR=1 FL=1|jgi:hypothetical protein|tara:strand:- start:346 stop:600 length:255 start_codon:yes stop_codon:yes gene_type:complete